MAQLGLQNLYVLAKDAGFNHEDSWKMALIAVLESGGDTQAHNPRGDDNSYGLWQINMKAHDRGKFGISANEELYDPQVNARAAKIVFDEAGGFGPWSVWPDVQTIIRDEFDGSLPQLPPAALGTSGTGSEFLDFIDKYVPGGSVAVDNAGDVVPDVIPDGLAAIGQFFGNIGSVLFSSDFWKAVGLGAVALLLLIVGGLLVIQIGRS